LAWIDSRTPTSAIRGKGSLTTVELHEKRGGLGNFVLSRSSNETLPILRWAKNDEVDIRGSVGLSSGAKAKCGDSSLREE
jgi:hypothetical protein